MTKRIGNRFDTMCRMENIRKAIKKSIKHKSKYRAVKQYKKDPSVVEKMIRDLLVNKTYKVSPIKEVIKITDANKERDIKKVPLFPDNTVQHCAIGNMKGKWIKSLTSDCYNCIPKRGITSNVRKYNMAAKIKRDILKLSKDGKPLYFAKWDIRKHYPTIRHSVYRKAYRHDCKDKGILWLMDTFNYSCEGLPIGWSIGVVGSHLILRRLDHWIKEELGVKYYYRFADDMVILHNDKKQLHEWLWRIRNFLWYELKQEMKGNYKIAPISEGIDFGGYVFRVGYTRLRRRIKKKMIRKRHNDKSMASYMGIMKHCDCRNLIKEVVEKDNKHMTKISDLGIKIDRKLDGTPIKIEKVEGEVIKILDFDVRDSTKKANSYWLRMQIEKDNHKYFIKGGYQDLAAFLLKVDKSLLPLEDVVILNDRGYYFEGTRNI